MIGTIVLTGHLLWIFERRHNAESFPTPYPRGAWEAVWWSVSTIITGGCENKVISTVTGRFIATASMIGGIVLVALLTSTLTTTMTVDQVTGTIRSPRDLFGKTIACQEGGVVVDASQGYDMAQNPAVNMQMNGMGAKLWEDLTGDAYKNSYNIAIVLDETVYSAPGVTSGPISGGRSEITGDFSLNDAIDLANVLRAGKLPASADIIQSEIIGPSLGKESIEKGINSFLIALVLVLIWMYFYYGRAGLFADSALVLNIVLIFGFLSGLGAVLTLPGIAGIVLTIGMSVDANVLIFERIREELRREKGLKQAVSDGFSNCLLYTSDAADE